MKMIARIILYAVLAMLCGFSIGYNRGMRAEQRAWLATAKYQNGITYVVYSNPHHGGVVATRLPRPVNAPPDIAPSR